MPGRGVALARTQIFFWHSQSRAVQDCYDEEQHDMKKMRRRMRTAQMDPAHYLGMAQYRKRSVDRQLGEYKSHPCSYRAILFAACRVRYLKVRNKDLGA